MRGNGTATIGWGQTLSEHLPRHTLAHSYTYTYMQLLCVGITRYPRAVWDMETSIYRSPYRFLILVNSGFRNINLAANTPLLFTSCSRILKCLIVNCPMWSTLQNISRSRKRCFPHDSLRKILETFIRFFPSFFNRKYVHTVTCTVVFVGPAFCVQLLTLIRAALLLVVFPAVPTKTMVHAVALTVFLPFLAKDPFL